MCRIEEELGSLVVVCCKPLTALKPNQCGFDLLCNNPEIEKIAEWTSKIINDCPEWSRNEEEFEDRIVYKYIACNKVEPLIYNDKKYDVVQFIFYK